MTGTSLQYYMQDHTLGQFLTSAPGAILSKCEPVLSPTSFDILMPHSVRELHAQRVSATTTFCESE